MKLVKACSCNYKGKKCVYIDRLLGIIESLKKEYFTEYIDEIKIISQPGESYWKITRQSGFNEFELEFCCLYLKRSSLNDIRKCLINVIENNEDWDEEDEEEKCFGDCHNDDITTCDDCRCGSDCCEKCGDPCYGDCQNEDVSCENCRCSEECCEHCGEGKSDSFSNLSYKDKIKVVAEKLKLPKYCEIKTIDKNFINGYTNGKEIMITSGALELLSEEELAFVLGHEQAHIEKNHVGQSKALIEEAFILIENIATDKNTGFLKKVLKIGGTGILSVAAFSAQSHLHELEADKKAKEKLKDAGYPDNAGSDFMDRFDTPNQSFSLTHPSPGFRKRKLK